LAKQLTLEEYESIDPRVEIVHEACPMTFATPSSLALWRVRTIREKEPWTLEWIARFAPGDVLVDCGANVGMYTIWASVTRRARVVAFEPEAQNYALLNRNIRLNGVEGLVSAYCLGLSDHAGISALHMGDLRAGASCHSVGDALDYRHKPMQTVAFSQGCVSATLDELVGSGAIPVPNHLKIDVDGFEPRVIAGARRTLREPRLRSVLVETNPELEDHRAMVDELRAFGFRLDPAQVERATRKDGPFKGVAEHVFER
jgi:FkbM family methyltransferase